MSSFTQSLVGVFLCALASAQVQPIKRASQIYFFHDLTKQRWCGYLSKAEWTARIRDADVDMMGYLVFAGQTMVEINVRQLSVSGDWALDDTYAVDANQNVTRLQRDLGYFSEHRQVKESFQIRGGRAALVSRSASDLDTHKPLSSPKAIDSYGTWPIIMAIRDFPFQPVLGVISEVRKKQSYCVP